MAYDEQQGYKMALEERARQTIDAQLKQACWIIQDRSDFNRTASTGGGLFVNL